ncbi:hypothetical protein C817_04907 [Dorea sp. 5-2]|nr:hypothetical protein C817_04907 [Dorea sp. 5-2]
MEKKIYITEEERAKCQKVADAFAELYEMENIVVLDVGKYGFVDAITFTDSVALFEELWGEWLNTNRRYHYRCRKLLRKKAHLLRQKTAMVFQNYSLFKNKTVLDNVLLPMTLVRKKPKKEAESEALSLLSQVALTDKMNEYPSRLSGGQQQRIGIARALAAQPDVLLFDEPTSSLDPELVGGILEIIRKLAVQHQCTMLIVTHEMRFALEIADRIIFMENGKIVEQGTPEAMIHQANHKRIQDFMQTISNR